MPDAELALSGVKGLSVQIIHSDVGLSDPTRGVGVTHPLSDTATASNAAVASRRLGMSVLRHTFSDLNPDSSRRIHARPDRFVVKEEGEGRDT